MVGSTQGVMLTPPPWSPTLYSYQLLKCSTKLIYLELLLCVIPRPTESKKACHAKVMYSYVAENPDELNLQPGQVREYPHRPLDVPHSSFHPH